MKVKENTPIVLMGLFLLLAQLSDARGQSHFYEKKTIQVIVGSALFKDGRPEGSYQNMVGFWVSGTHRAEVWGGQQGLPL